MAIEGSPNVNRIGISFVASRGFDQRFSSCPKRNTIIGVGRLRDGVGVSQLPGLGGWNQ